MATAAVTAKEVAQQSQPSRTLYVQACVGAYYEWRDAGLCPQDLAAQLSVLLPDGGTWEGCSADGMALLYWDKTVNGGSLLNYDFERNYRAALLRQASQILGAYMRRTVTKAWGRVRVPGVARFPKRARKEKRFSLHRVSRMTASEVGLVIESMMLAVKAKALRARELGAHRKSIQAALLAAEEEANRVYELRKN